MKPLIDGDLLIHEISWVGQTTEGGVVIPRPFDSIHPLLDRRVEQICLSSEADEAPVIYFTDSEWLAKQQGREFVPNFRIELSKRKGYKTNRKQPKPFHYYNVLVTLMSSYECIVADSGLEADDQLGIDQVEAARNGKETIICSRDKDLRMIPGWHFSWEVGKQPSYGPLNTDEFGGLFRISNKDIGYGKWFLYYQMLAGDATDNIPGIKGVGDVAAKKILKDCRNLDQLHHTVLRKYEQVYGSDGYYEFLEQGNLLFIRHNRNEDFITHIRKALRWEDG